MIVDDTNSSPTRRPRARRLRGESIARIPVRTIASGVQEAVATLPGWATEDNGLLHVRGIDDGFLYVIDGVPVYERLDPLNGMGPPLANIESINVITGYIPAEFGHKAGGVIDVRSKSIGKDWLGTVAGRTRQRRRDRRFRAGRVAILPCPRDDPRGERRSSRIGSSIRFIRTTSTTTARSAAPKAS